MDMDPRAKSEYLDKLYSLYNNSEHPVEEPDQSDVEDELSPQQMCNLKRNALKGIAHHMCMHAIPCDKGCHHELKSDVDRHIDQYFTMDNGKLLQYFNDTKNSVTDAIREAINSELEKGKPVSEDDNAFITAVVGKVTDDEDVEEVIKTVEQEIRNSAEQDIQKIVDDVKDDEETDDGTNPSPMDTPDGIDPTADAQVNESVFHHYLIKQYKENAIPQNPEEMLITPMVETALHYVTRILFNDGFARKMGMEVR